MDALTHEITTIIYGALLAATDDQPAMQVDRLRHGDADLLIVRLGDKRFDLIVEPVPE